MRKIYVRLRSQIIQEYLIKNNISLRSFAHQIGYDSAQVSNWINGKRFIGNIAREKIQTALKMEWDSLFEIVDDAQLLKMSDGN